jgi:hypothetical protein
MERRRRIRILNTVLQNEISSILYVMKRGRWVGDGNKYSGQRLVLSKEENYVLERNMSLKFIIETELTLL